MQDQFGRTIDYLRVSVTDRCNMHCRYCMPKDFTDFLPRSSILSFEEIVQVVQYGVQYGLKKIRLTGGEPLMRKGITKLIAMLSQIREIEDLAMTTNAYLLAKYADSLAEAGLHRVNISLDTLDPQKFALITGGYSLSKVLKGIDAAERAGLTPIKINCVVEKNSDEPDALAVREFSQKRGFTVRFIKQMSMARGQFTVVQGGSGGDCPRCNRLRLTSDGYLRPCLFSDLAFSIRKLGIAKAYHRAIGLKPKAGKVSLIDSFSRIGG